MMTRICLLIILLLSYAVYVYAQSPTPKASPSPTLPQIDFDPKLFERNKSIIIPHYAAATAANTSDVAGTRTAQETQLGWGVLGFGFLLIALEIAVMLRLKKGWGTQSIRVVGITLVVVAGLFLIVTGYSQEQIAPMIGLLGTITGFLLGKTASQKETE